MQTRILPNGARAFTLTEILVTMAVFMLVMSGVIVAHVGGMKYFNITASKLSATDGGRKLVGQLLTEIRGAKVVKVGTGNASTFTEAADGTPQQGQAIQIYPTTASNNWVRYYLDTGDRKLKRVYSATPTRQTVVAEYITNSVVFASENFSGSVLTEQQQNRVIRVQLQFFQIQYPITAVQKGSLYDYYQLNTRVTRRALD